MSDAEGNIEALCDDLEDQYLSVGPEPLSRRDSDNSDTSQVSSLAGTRRRSRGGQMSQVEGGERRGKKKKVYPKVRSGCDTCKQRKIKCDEAKPNCRNCQKAQRQCLGYHPPQPKIFELPQRRQPLGLTSEQELFAYFQNHVAVKLAEYRPLQLDLSFWQQIVPDLSADYPAIRHGILALAAIIMKLEVKYSIPRIQNVIESDQYFALDQQTKLIVEMQPASAALLSGMSVANQSRSATLICCLLLTLCELWDLGVPLTFVHLAPGLDICNIVKKTSPSKSPQSEVTEIDGTEMFPAYRYFADCALVGLDNATEYWYLFHEFAEKLDPIVPAVVANIGEAYAVMDKVLRQIAKLEPGVPTIELKNYLDTILFTFKHGLDSALPDAAANFRMLSIHHSAACILLHAITEGSETAYDQHMTDFDLVVSEAESLLGDSRAWFGMIPPLFLAATKCRSPTLRHRALKVLHRANQVERLWTSCTAYQIAKEVIRIEEETAVSFNSRIRLTSIEFNPTASKIDLGYSMAQSDEISFATSSIPWHRDEKEINTMNNPDSFWMPNNILKVCGYSALLLSFRRSSCHCGAEL